MQIAISLPAYFPSLDHLAAFLGLLLQAGQSPYSDSSSARASTLLREQVKHTVAEAAASNDPAALPSSSPTTAAIALQSPAGTSQQALQSLVGVDAASLGPILRPEDQTLDESQSVQTAFEAFTNEAGPSTLGTNGAHSVGGLADGEISTSSQLPTNLTMLQFARQSEAERYQKKPKLESFDKIIGRPPNTPHHVSLQAAPTQKAYLPQWLASPLGMQAPQRASSTAMGAKPVETGNGSMPASRFTTEDTELNYSPPQRSVHRDMSLRVSPPPQRQRQLHQADPNEPVTPPETLAQGAPATGAHPFATLSHSAFSPDRHKPLRPLSRAASDTTICKSNSVASLSAALAKVQSGSNVEGDNAEGSFVSLHLQTVRPTAPKPYQAGHLGRQSPEVTGELPNNLMLALLVIENE